MIIIEWVVAIAFVLFVRAMDKRVGYRRTTLFVLGVAVFGLISNGVHGQWVNAFIWSACAAVAIFGLVSDRCRERAS